MAKFNGFILTEKGRELLAKGLAGETITFTKMAIGDGTSLTSERERTALVNQITTLPILNINVKRNGTCEINVLLTNKSVTTGFYIKELGIFAHGNDNVEILYAYNISTSPDFVPPFSANNVVEIEYVDTIIVDQVANVTAVIDPSITYITKKYADENYLVSSRLTEILGLEFGGNIQDIGNKTKGKFYYDSVTKFYYECIEDNSLTYNDSGKFRAISNKPLSDKVENLFGFGESWIKFPNGLVLFWKSYLITEYPQTCHFPLEFNSVPNILVTPVYGGTNLDFNVYVDTATKKSVKVFNKNKGWIVILAIGYAK